MDVKKLSAPKLEALYRQRDTVARGFVDAFINAGRGYETNTEIRESAKRGYDPLALAYCRAMDEESEVRHEMERRKRYHGSLKPIKSTTF